MKAHTFRANPVLLRKGIVFSPYTNVLYIFMTMQFILSSKNSKKFFLFYTSACDLITCKCNIPYTQHIIFLNALTWFSCRSHTEGNTSVVFYSWLRLKLEVHVKLSAWVTVVLTEEENIRLLIKMCVQIVNILTTTVRGIWTQCQLACLSVCLSVSITLLIYCFMVHLNVVNCTFICLSTLCSIVSAFS